MTVSYSNDIFLHCNHKFDAARTRTLHRSRLMRCRCAQVLHFLGSRFPPVQYGQEIQDRILPWMVAIGRICCAETIGQRQSRPERMLGRQTTESEVAVLFFRTSRESCAGIRMHIHLHGQILRPDGGAFRGVQVGPYGQTHEATNCKFLPGTSPHICTPRRQVGESDIRNPKGKEARQGGKEKGELVVENWIMAVCRCQHDAVPPQSAPRPTT